MYMTISCFGCPKSPEMVEIFQHSSRRKVQSQPKRFGSGAAFWPTSFRVWVGFFHKS